MGGEVVAGQVFLQRGVQAHDLLAADVRDGGDAVLGRRDGEDRVRQPLLAHDEAAARRAAQRAAASKDRRLRAGLGEAPEALLRGDLGHGVDHQGNARLLCDLERLLKGEGLLRAHDGVEDGADVVVDGRAELFLLGGGRRPRHELGAHQARLAPEGPPAGP